jgi:predicted ribosome-associated RNA-binding protein Tma20
MQIFYSGGFPYYTPQEIDNLLGYGIKNRLFSYHFVQQDPKMYDGFKYIEEKYPDYGVMMDSGAFSVAMKGAKVNIEEYAGFLEKHKHSITVPVNLDVVPAGQSTLKNLEEGAIEGWANLEYMESKGLKVLHTYHSAEDDKWLYKMMDKFEYFGVSKTGDVEGVMGRLDRVFSKLCDKNGRCRWKVHGFAVTSPTMMTRFPWATVDSASWVKYGCYGVVVMFKNGKFVSIGMSDRKKTLWAKKGQHYNNLNKVEKRLWEDEMERRGVNRDILQDNRERDIWNIRSFLDLEKWLTEQDIRFKPKRSIFII